MSGFRNLIVYKNAKLLVSQVYDLLKKFPKEEQYALCDQLRRAVISIPSNIAEGSGRSTDKDQAHFYAVAYASAMEVLAQMDIAHDLKYINTDEFTQIEQMIEQEAKMLSALYAKRKNISPCSEASSKL